MNVQVFYTKCMDVGSEGPEHLLVATTIGAIHDYVYGMTKDKDVLKNIDDTIRTATLHLTKDGLSKPPMLGYGIPAICMYGKRPSIDDKNQRVRDIYTADTLLECRDWMPHLFSNVDKPFRQILEEMFVPCEFIPTDIPQTRSIYGMIKVSEKDANKVVANLAVPYKDGLYAPSRRFYFPKKTWESARPGLAFVTTEVNGTYGFMEGSMVHTKFPSEGFIAQTLQRISHTLAKYPDAVIEYLEHKVTDEQIEQLVAVYETPAPRDKDSTPLAVMLSGAATNDEEAYIRYDGELKVDDVRVNGFTANMLAIFAPDRKGIRVRKVSDVLLQNVFDCDAKQLTESFKATECIYAKKFKSNRFTPIDEKLPWAYPNIMTVALGRGLIQMLSLDKGVAKVVTLKNLNALLGVTADIAELAELLRGMKEFNDVAAEDIIRLGRRGKIIIDNP